MSDRSPSEITPSSLEPLCRRFEGNWLVHSVIFCLLPQPSQRLTAPSRSRYLLRNDARVVALSRTTTPELESIQKAHADSLLLCKGDVASDTDNKRVVDLALAKFGQIDALIR